MRNLHDLVLFDNCVVLGAPGRNSLNNFLWCLGREALQQLVLVGYGATSFADILHRPADNAIRCPLRKGHDDIFLDIDGECALRNSQGGGGGGKESHFVGSRVLTSIDWLTRLLLYARGINGEL